MSWTSGRGDAGFTKAQRAETYRAKGRSCYRCGEYATQVDHIVPWSEGGSDALENRGPICDTCHDVKSRNERLRGYNRHRAKARRPQEPHP